MRTGRAILLKGKKSFNDISIEEIVITAIKAGIVIFFVCIANLERNIPRKKARNNT